jgi:S-phase kinase-associated protein 1
MTEIEKPLKSQNMADVVQKWYADFVSLDQVLLFELILAAVRLVFRYDLFHF